MIGLNKELKERQEIGNPVRVGLIGTGQMGTDIVAESREMDGLEVVITADVDLERAKEAYKIGKIEGEVVTVKSAEEADKAIAEGKYAAASDYRVLTDCENIDVVIEATGVPEIGARAALRTVRRRHDIAMMNVETDITVGPLLRWYTEKKNQLYALAAGDEPAACKELYDFADALGFTIVAAGKGKNNPLDWHASPEDEDMKKEAARRGLNPYMLVEFVDGSKTMIEMAAVSNATGLIPDVRGMHGPETDRDHLNETFRLKEDGGILNQTGVVDFGVGRVAPGVFLIIKTDHPRLQEAMVLRDMGDGPYYTLFRPFHLCSIEVPLTCALMAIRRRSNMVPMDRLVSEVFSVAKRDLKPGEELDKIGGVSYYSHIDTYENARKGNFLPIGLAKGAEVKEPIAVDTAISMDVVEVKPSTVYSLWKLQNDWMEGNISEEELLKEVDKVAD